MFRLLTRLDALIAALTAAPLAVGLAVWSRLPARVPIHWDWRGEVNGWSSPAFAVFFVPALGVGIWLLLLLVPMADRYRENLIAARRDYALLRLAVAVFLAALHVFVLASALGFGLPVIRLVPLLLGGLFFVLGVVMPRLPRNETAGLRLPWTLASDEAWKAAHLDAGLAFRQAAAVFLIAAFLPETAVFAGVALAVLWAVVGPSWRSWRRSRRLLPKPPPGGTLGK